MSRTEGSNRMKNIQTQNGRSGPSQEEIQKKAYELYQQKGGDALENWLEAERTIVEKSQK